MTEAQKIAHKKRLQKNCIDVIEGRIHNIRISMNAAQATANNEEKSSAGDKFETSRAMSHLEKDMYAKQLSSNMKEIESLLSVDCKRGSFVNCGTISFFIASGLGKLSFENEIVFFVSPVAPVLKILSGKTTGETIIFNKEQYTIKDVY